MHTQPVELINKRGLHARAAAKLVQVCKPFSAEINLSFNDKEANCKNIMQLLMLAAPYGSLMTLTAQGSDAAAAIEAILELIQNRFDEED